MSHKVIKGNFLQVPMSLKNWQECKKIRKRKSRAYHKQKMLHIMDYDADESFNKHIYY